jgi:hypothetical protein
MDCNLIFDVHLVELVNAADSVIRKHQCTCLNTVLAGFGVFAHTCSQTSRTACFATCVDCTWEELADVLKELALCSSGIANDADVNVTAKF